MLILILLSGEKYLLQKHGDGTFSNILFLLKFSSFLPCMGQGPIKYGSYKEISSLKNKTALPSSLK